MIITEPKWKDYVVRTDNPIFTSEQCKMIIEAGRSEPPQQGQVNNDDKPGGKIDTKTRISHISWIPFKKMLDMYRDIEKLMHKTNRNHFGFDGMDLTEPAQYTEYSENGFYDWHIDSNINCAHQPPVRKISMTCLLSPENEFEGGDLEIMSEGKVVKLKQGQIVFFASFIRHRIKPVIKGNRKSLVMWFGGPPLR